MPGLDSTTKLVADVTALRACSRISKGVAYLVLSTGAVYKYDGTSSATDEGDQVVKPSKNSGNGRFLRMQGDQLVAPGQKAVNVLRLASGGQDGETVTIGADVYEISTKTVAAAAAGHILLDLHAGTTVKAQGTITQSVGDVSDGDTVTIDGKVYTFQTVLTNVDGHILIADTASHTLDNLVSAINLTAGAGTAYAALTTKAAKVTAAKGSSTTVIITAIAGGTAGNSITLAKSAAHYAVDAATLGTTTSGVDPSAGNVCDSLLAAINASATEKVSAVKVSANELLIIAQNPGVITIACTKTLALTNNAWAAAAMYGGKAAAVRKVSVQTRVPTAAEVALGNMHFCFDFVPTVAICFVTVTATPDLALAHDGGVTIDSTNKKITVDNAGATDWATTNTLTVMALA